MQNKLMKLLLNKEPTHSTNMLHKELRILKVADIHRHSTLQFVYKCLYGDVNPNFENYFVSRENAHNHNTRYTHNLQKTIIKTEVGRSTTQHTAVTLWNQLPTHTKNAPKDYIFKKITFENMLSKYEA